MNDRDMDRAAGRRTSSPSRRRGRAIKAVATALLAIVVVGCSGALPTELPTLPAVAPSFEVPSLPALPTLPPKPTEKPTEKPKPTEAPTDKPTEKPTEEPKPTEKPAEPTAVPTEKPAEPTAKPTEKPTAEPTAKPTEKPAEPTAKPTEKPATTPAPTATPKPTPSPTPKPTPTPAPTQAPEETVTVTGAIEVGFIASSLSGPPPLAVKFYGHVLADVNGMTTSVPLSSEESTTSQLWTFGDGGLSFDPEPIHIYQTPGLYTVTLTVSGAPGTDTRVKRDLIAVGTAAELKADNQDVEFLQTPAFLLTLAVSPPLAAFLAVRDHIEQRRQAGQEVVSDGHGLGALILNRRSGGSVTATDLAIESFLNSATRARHRLDGNALDHLDRSTGIAGELRNLLLMEALVSRISPDDTRLTAFNQAIEGRVQEFVSTLDGLGRSTE
jgi:hypothetical protein